MINLETNIHAWRKPSRVSVCGCLELNVESLSLTLPITNASRKNKTKTDRSVEIKTMKEKQKTNLSQFVFVLDFRIFLRVCSGRWLEIVEESSGIKQLYFQHRGRLLNWSNKVTRQKQGAINGKRVSVKQDPNSQR